MILLPNVSKQSAFYSILQFWNSMTYLFQVLLPARVIFVCNGQDTSSPNSLNCLETVII